NPEACALLRADLDEAYNRFITAGHSPDVAIALVERMLEMRRKAGDPCYWPPPRPTRWSPSSRRYLPALPRRSVAAMAAAPPPFVAGFLAGNVARGFAGCSILRPGESRCGVPIAFLRRNGFS